MWLSQKKGLTADLIPTALCCIRARVQPCAGVSPVHPNDFNERRRASLEGDAPARSLGSPLSPHPPRAGRRARRSGASTHRGGEDGEPGSYKASPEDGVPARRWLRVGPAAAYLGIGVGTLNKLRTYGGGPSYAKIKHVVIYDILDLDSYAAARKVRSTSEPVRAT